MAETFICEAVGPPLDKSSLFSKRQRDGSGRYASGGLSLCIRSCAQCGAPFKPNRLNGAQIKAGYIQRCCSGKCAGEFRRDSPADKRAKRKAYNDRYRGRLNPALLESKKCIGCLAEISRNRTRCAPCAYASAGSDRKARYERITGRRSIDPNTPRQCKRCDARFIPIETKSGKHHRRLFCSQECTREFHRKVGGATHRKRARHHGVAYEYINTICVLERDNYRCQVCGVSTPKRLRGSVDDRAPELDHRIPMAMGGGHLWSNVQCACRKCNLAKGGTIIAGQTNFFDRIEERRRHRQPT